MTLRSFTLIISIVTAGLMAGLFFGWLVSVIPGLRKVEDNTYISTMQNINREIVNPAFVLPFMLAPVLLAAAAIAYLRAGEHRKAWFLAGAAVTYLVGVLGVTVGGNIPLNNTLDSFDASAVTAAADSMRQNYETRWNQWHSLRTAASVLAFTLATVAATISEGDA